MSLIINAMLFTTLTINQPMTNVFEPGQSVLPERFRSITMPAEYPIMDDGLASITEPSAVTEKEESEPETGE